MNSLEQLMNMVATEVLEAKAEAEMYEPTPRKEESNLPPIDYKLELIQQKDGTYCWVED